MTTINRRFREERQRLKLSHARVGEICSVREATVIAWEKSSKIPAEALAVLMREGMDVYYILTDRAKDAPQPLMLDPDEVKLVDLYRACDESDRRTVRMLTLALAGKAVSAGKSPTIRKPKAKKKD